MKVAFFAAAVVGVFSIPYFLSELAHRKTVFMLHHLSLFYSTCPMFLDKFVLILPFGIQSGDARTFVKRLSSKWRCSCKMRIQHQALSVFFYRCTADLFRLYSRNIFWRTHRTWSARIIVITKRNMDSFIF